MNKKIEKQALTIWKDICSKADEVDPEGLYIWEGMFVGVVIALGGTADEARDLYDKAYKLLEQAKIPGLPWPWRKVGKAL